MSAHSRATKSSSSAAPPPQQQQQQQQQSHVRSSSHGNGWFSGTMEVISGMAAPRPSTPQQHLARSMSAPNSPARNMFSINRLPSQDSLDRSIHNESAHGKSTAQIVRDLKHSNSALMAKQATLEAQFMNQLSEVTRSFEEQRQRMEESSRSLKRQVAQLEAYRASAEEKLKAKENSLSKVKEESAFQRHTISDLKNQLYQLQSEMEEQEMDKSEDMDRLLGDNQEMARELARYQQELAASNRIREELERQMKGEQPADSYYNQWKETNNELESQKKRLSITEIKLNEIDGEKEMLKEEHAMTIVKLQDELQEQTSAWKRKERELQSQIESLEFTDNQTLIDLKRDLEDRDDTIAGLQIQLDQYADKAAELAAMLEQARKDAENQELYRRDEAEDLRILHDAQEEEISKLRQELDNVTRELELRDEQLHEANKQLKSSSETDDSSEELELLRKAVTQSKEKLRNMERQLERTEGDLERAKSSQKNSSQKHEGMDESEAIRELADKLSQSRSTAIRLEQQIEELEMEKGEQIEKLSSAVDSLTKEKEDFSKQLETLQAEKEDAISSLKATKDELSKLQKDLEAKGTDSEETAALKMEIHNLEMDVYHSVQSEKAARQTIQELQSRMKELEEQNTKESANNDEVERLRKELKEAKFEAQNAKSPPTSVASESTKKEIQRLKTELQRWESGANTTKLKRQLREAQVALVALDDEKKEMGRRHRELLSAVEKKKEEIQRDRKKDISDMQRELDTMQSQVEELESEKENFEETIKHLRSEVKKLSEENEKSAQREITPPPPPPQPQDAPSSSSQALVAERDALKTRLKDRDTTIAALVKSSMLLEAKISSMENEAHSVRSVQSDEKKVADGELEELRRSVAEFKQRQPRANDELAALKKQLKIARADAQRWQKALKNDGGTGSEYRFQISSLEKELEDKIEKIQERDLAIENLVNQSMTQEAHVKDLRTRLASLTKQLENSQHFHGDSDETKLKNEVIRLQQETEMFAGQIIDMDEEVESLRKNLSARNEQIFSLKKELSELQAVQESKPADDDKTREALAEMEQELSQVKSDLRARDLQLKQLQKELDETKKAGSGTQDINRIQDLQAEIDELQEANESNRLELRDLRRQLWQAKEAAGKAEDLQNELAQANYALEEARRRSPSQADQPGQGADPDMQKRLDEALAEKKALEQKMATQNENVRRNKNELVEKLEAELENKERKIKDLEMKLSHNDEEQVAIFQSEIERLRQEVEAKTKSIENLEKKLLDKNSAIENSEGLKLKLVRELTETKDKLSKMEDEANEMRDVTLDDKGKDEILAKENEELLKAKDQLTAEITDLKKQLESAKASQGAKDELEGKLEKAIKAREASEKSIVDTYEKRLSALAKDRDVTIDSLRNELTESRGRVGEDAAEMARHLDELQKENRGLREQFEVELQAKNQQLYALEHTLHAQEQIVESMKAEMDQLQSGMEHANKTRRGEVEDLQQEVIQMESRALKQDREITALKMELEEGKLEHKAEILRLRDVIASMEKESPLAKQVAELQYDDRMLQVRERLEQLKNKNTALQEENLKLGGRLERAMIEIKSFETEKKQAAAMEHENTSLRTQVKELEVILSKVQRPQVSASPAPGDKENPIKAQDKPTKPHQTKHSKKGFKGLFRRKGSFSTDDVIKEEKEEETGSTQ